MTRWKAVVLGAMFALGACAGHRPPFQPLQADSAVETSATKRPSSHIERPIRILPPRH
jgi:hypothetical protein